MELTLCPVLFNEVEHTYTYEGKTLSGITSIIHKLIFPDLYSGVSQSTLAQAAERGTRLHNFVQLYVSDMLNEDDKKELQPFIDATKGIGWIASEYLVSDLQTVASSIDLVGNESGNLCLYDLKTTAVLNTEYLRWQLSVYKYLFEKQNCDRHVVGIRAIHFRDGKCAVVNIEPLPTEYVEALLAAYTNGDETFDNPLHHIPDDLNDLLQEYAANEAALAEIDEVRKPLEERKKNLQEAVISSLQSHNLSQIENDTAKVTIGKDSERKTFDLKSFMSSDIYKQAADTYAPFVKTTIVKGRLTITLR